MTLGVIISLIGILISTGFSVGGIIMSAINSANEALSFFSRMLTDYVIIVPAPFTTVCVFSVGLMIFTKARRG